MSMDTKTANTTANRLWPNFENSTYGQFSRISFEHTFQIQLLDFPLETTRKSRIHCRASRENDMFIKLWANVNVTLLDCTEH